MTLYLHRMVQKSKPPFFVIKSLYWPILKTLSLTYAAAIIADLSSLRNQSLCWKNSGGRNIQRPLITNLMLVTVLTYT